jgi:hypothetical protein
MVVRAEFFLLLVAEFHVLESVAMLGAYYMLGSSIEQWPWMTLAPMVITNLSAFSEN